VLVSTPYLCILVKNIENYVLQSLIEDLLTRLFDRPDRCDEIDGFSNKFSQLEQKFIKASLGKVMCPITLEFVQNPVVCCRGGHIAEENKIRRWALSNAVCPQCREPLLPQQLPDTSIMRCLSEYIFSAELMQHCPVNGSVGEYSKRASDERLFADQASIEQFLRTLTKKSQPSTSAPNKSQSYLGNIWRVICSAFWGVCRHIWTAFEAIGTAFSYFKFNPPQWFRVRTWRYSIYTILTPIVFLSLGLVMGHLPGAFWLLEFLAALAIVVTFFSTTQQIFTTLDGDKDRHTWLGTDNTILLSIAVIVGGLILGIAFPTFLLFTGTVLPTFSFCTVVLPLMLTALMTMNLFRRVFTGLELSRQSAHAITRERMNALCFFAVTALMTNLLLFWSLPAASVVSMVSYMIVEIAVFFSSPDSFTTVTPPSDQARFNYNFRYDELGRRRVIDMDPIENDDVFDDPRPPSI